MADVIAALTAQFAASRAEYVAQQEAAQKPAEPVAETEPVVEPAPEPEAVKETAGPLEFKAAYVSDDGVIYLIGAFAGNVDKDQDVLQTKALVKMAYDFTAAEKRAFSKNHESDLGADLVASMPGAPILKSGRVMAYGEELPKDDPITGICLKSEPIAWFLGVKPHDPEVVEKARQGGIGASWGAYVTREEL